MKLSLVVIFWGGVLCLSLFSCKSKSDVIGMLIASPVFESDLKFFSEKIEQSGYKVKSANANYNDQEQIRQAQELIEQGVKVLVIIPVNTNTAAAIVRMAVKNNVKTIAYERIISNCNLDYFISFDNVRIGELLASEAMKLKPEGDYFIINGDMSDRNATWVQEGFHKALSASINSNKIKVVYETYIEDWSSADAAYEFKRYMNITNNIPDVILSAYTGMNSGLFEYFEHEGITKIPVVAGQETDNKETRTDTTLKQQIALLKSNKIEAEASANLAISIIKGEEIEINTKFHNGFKDVDAILIKDMKVELKKI